MPFDGRNSVSGLSGNGSFPLSLLYLDFVLYAAPLFLGISPRSALAHPHPCPGLAAAAKVKQLKSCISGCCSGQASGKSVFIVGKRFPAKTDSQNPSRALNHRLLRMLHPFPFALWAADAADLAFTVPKSSFKTPFIPWRKAIYSLASYTDSFRITIHQNKYS